MEVKIDVTVQQVENQEDIFESLESFEIGQLSELCISREIHPGNL